MENPALQTTTLTYSFQEVTFSRRLQRFCLEQTYRWFVDPQSDPDFIMRVFGSIPCLHKPQAVERTYQKVLRAGVGDALESNVVPFYSVGGAGTHYPRVDEHGRSVYPVNMHKPRKTKTGRMSTMKSRLRSTCGAGPDDGDGEERIESYLKRLELDGGDWFDCHDVQGYLNEMGILLDEASLSSMSSTSSPGVVEIPATTMQSIYGLSDRPTNSRRSREFYSEENLLHLNTWGEEDEEEAIKDIPSANDDDLNIGEVSSAEWYILDIEHFFNREFQCTYIFQQERSPANKEQTVLLQNVRILGRAPGFRRRDVDAALRSAVRQQTNSLL
jgi:hypothetical protein